MHTLSEAQLLELWEAGRNAAPWRRALLALSAADPEGSPDELARLSVGARDNQLLSLHAETFGTELRSVATCPACGASLEFSLDCQRLRQRTANGGERQLNGRTKRHRFTFRLPNSLDLAAVVPGSDPSTARIGILRRCIESLELLEDGRANDSDELPAEVIAAVAERMSQADPMADIQIALACPDCEHNWEVGLDIVSFFWRELESWASRTIEDVHLLASTYGWTEPEVLSLTAFRRNAYLNLATA